MSDDWDRLAADGAPRRKPIKVEELEPSRPIAAALGDRDVRRDLFAMIREKMDLAEAEMIGARRDHTDLVFHQGGLVYLKGLINDLRGLLDDTDAE